MITAAFTTFAIGDEAIAVTNGRRVKVTVYEIIIELKEGNPQLLNVKLPKTGRTFYRWADELTLIPVEA